MQARTLAATILCVFCISIGQILFKKAANTLPNPITILSLIENLWLVTSLVVYAFTTIGWILILHSTPLNKAYPIMGLAFLMVPLLSWVLLKEPLQLKTLIGGIFIIIGIVISSN